MNPNSGQRMNRPLFVPTLMPAMGGASMQQVVITAGGGMPVFTSSAIGQPITLPAVSLQSLPTEHAPHTQPVAMAMQPIRPQRPTPKADLYLCKTSDNASEPPSEGDIGNKDKVSLSDLEHSFKDLDSQQVKDSLSSFLPHIPGEFDRMPDTMLRQLLEQRTIGGKDFSPLSGQALLGFRLLPGPLPEICRMDPPSLDSKPHHKKRKHKHKNIEKGEDNGDGGNGPPTSKIKLPSDAYTFIKPDMSSSSHISLAPSHTPSHPHTYMMGGDSSVGGVIKQHQPTKEILAAVAHTSTFQPMVAIPNLQVAGAPTPLLHTGGIIMDPRLPTYPGKKPKKKKDKTKKDKGEKKEKKKKKKHHQDPSGTGPSILPHQPPSFNQFSNP